MATMGPPPPLNKQKQKQEEEAAAAALDLYPDPNSVEMSLPVPLPPSLVQLLACCKQMQLGHKEDQKGEQRRILYSSSEYKDHLMDDLYLLPPPEKWDQREVQEEDFATAITEGGHHLLVKYGNFPGKLHQIITLCEVMGRTDIVSWCARK